ncbi:hypothetical protein MHU86_12699 [Fragilaria crotonensis]|nr:hypothetical protein MHU86_12699 [Fragilaria crotonensis]
MTDLPGGSPRDGSVPSVVRGNLDDASDVTPPGGSGARTNGQQLVEKTVKFRFLVNQSGEPVLPSKLHLHWIQAVQEYYGDAVQIMNNNGQTMPIVDTMRWTTAQHVKQFTIHHSSSRSRVGVYRLLRNNNCFLTEHQWTEDIWNTTQLGFVMGLDPQFYDVTTATEKLRQETAAEIAYSVQDSEVPTSLHNSTDQTPREDY